MQGALDVADAMTRPVFTLHLNLKQVPVEDVVSGLLPVRLPLSGSLSEVVDLRGAGFPGPDAAALMKGTVAGTLERGLLRQSPALKQLRSALGASNPTEVPFQTIAHALRIEGGRLLLDKVSGDLGKDLFSMSGSLGFDQTLDLKGLLRLAPSRVEGGGFLAQIANYAKDADGRIPIDLRITGSALSPKVSVQPANLIQSAGKGLVKDELTKFLGGSKGDSAKSEPQAARPKGLLKQLLGGKTAPDTTHPPKAAPVDSAAKPDSANPVRKALQRLLGK